MGTDNPSKEQLNQYFAELKGRIASYGAPIWTKYLDLGTHVVRLINYSKEFTTHVEKQLTYVLKDNAPSYDTTLVIFKESDEASGILQAYNPQTNTYYYSASNLEPEEFIKQGHIFVQVFNKILKTSRTGLVHGAVVGLDDKGVLICARGQRGKSTLAVLAMMQGFDYVSDDYLTLEKTNEGLFAYPIYSIITLSPRMYNELYDDLQGKFVSNNARKDKYVINIAPYHDSFRRRYPVSVCLFPEITDAPEPTIVPCNAMEKGRAITQLMHSTVRQTGDGDDIATIKKIMDFVKDFEFYRINLCADIHANVEVLREFVERHSEAKPKNLGKILR